MGGRALATDFDMVASGGQDAQILNVEYLYSSFPREVRRP